MKNILINIFFVFLMVLFSNTYLVFGYSNDSTTLQVDLVGFNSSSNEEIGIEVPDRIDLGELTNTGKSSDEVGVYINNTGTKNIRVTPQLADNDEEIFKYLFFRDQKTTSTNNTDLITFKQIGNYYLDIDKPLTGKTFRAGHCYLVLNLTEFSGRISEDVYDYSSEVIFIATER